ncbi:Type I restriction enzyme subunit [Sulfitobacter guttiformis KCTC 32187]|nr:Type I restriction enzyme subunit [Sulfitobacter guttiformis KCTC 32187]
MRPVKSIIGHKQVVGRGTRTFEGKVFFAVFDFGKAYEHFNDPERDGEPLPPESPSLRPTPTGEPSTSGPPEPAPEPKAKITIKLADGKKR